VYPEEIYKTSIKSGKTERFAKVDVAVQPAEYEVEQVFYPSKDGTQVSMFLVHKKGLEKNGAAPTYLSGYGGFNIAITPRFSPSLYPWLERGGLVAMPNLRGGGEYGETWHQSGMLANKQNVFDDFIAAAEWLVKEKWTSPAKLAASGRSNGGLLVGAAMTQRPDLFGAIVCGVPLLDMTRYHLFGIGKAWVPEYGDPEKPEDLKVLAAYSPYHRLQANTSYPALLMLSADSDDRVDPMHARKFTAAVEAVSRGKKPLLRIETKAGHGGGDLRKKAVELAADELAFLLDELGAVPPAPSGAVGIATP
jgi:prolyl oligopeptidase